MDQTLIEGLAALASNKPPEFIGTLKTEEGEWLPSEDVAAKFKEAFSAKFKALRQSGKDQGLKEKGTEFEKFLLTKHSFSNSTNLKGTEFLEAYLTDFAEKNVKEVEKEVEVPTEKELTKETALANPIVKELIKVAVGEKTAALETELNTERESFQLFKADIERSQVANAVKAGATQVLTAIKANLGDDEDTKAKRLNFFLESLNPDKFKLDKKGKPYPVNAEGNHLEDEVTFRKVSFADYIKDRNPYGVHDFDPKKGSGSPGGGQSSKSSGTSRFKTREELNTYLDSERDHTKRKEALKEWIEANPEE